MNLPLVLAVALLVCVSAAEASYRGQATYYGDNGWAGACAGQLPPLGRRWPPAAGNFGTNVALNSAQYSPSMCGKRIMFRGTGSGSGGNPLSRRWRPATITNLCPECKFGDIDLGTNGDGRWGVEWYFVGSSGNTVQSNGTPKRATAPKRKGSSFDWRRWLRITRARRNQGKGRKLLVLSA